MLKNKSVIDISFGDCHYRTNVLNIWLISIPWHSQWVQGRGFVWILRKSQPGRKLEGADTTEIYLRVQRPCVS